MKTVTQATYLGDVISENGTIDQTILQRSQRACGITSQISSMLNSICLGSFHFDIAMVLRDAKFVNSIMTNSEVWHNVQQNHIENLEKLDLNLLRKIMNGHSKTAKEAFFLELGIYPLRYVLAKRRFMYLWHILHREKTELIRKMYESQKCNYNKGDWGLILEEERRKYNLTLSDQEIANLSREKFKTIVSAKIQSHAFNYLKQLANKHSKSENIAKSDNLQKKAYFSDRRFSREDVQLLFALRTKMIDCKTNFREQFHQRLQCRICKEPNSIENEDHLLTCSVLNNANSEVNFSDVYGDIDHQYKATQAFKSVIRRRKVFLDVMDK